MIALTNNERFAYDAYRRFVQMYGNVVLNINKDAFDHELETLKHAIGPNAKDTDLSAAQLKALVSTYKAIVLEKTGTPFPENPLDQLKGAVEAVFASWNNDRAIVYRRMNKISDALGTAVNVQSMVFGNMGDDRHRRSLYPRPLERR